MQNGSPGNGVVTQIMTPHWQNQLLKCEVSTRLCTTFLSSFVFFSLSYSWVVKGILWAGGDCSLDALSLPAGFASLRSQPNALEYQ